MDYQKIYNSLIERSKNRLLEGYSEKHHIVPRCLGGTNKKENINALDPETNKTYDCGAEYLLKWYDLILLKQTSPNSQVL